MAGESIYLGMTLGELAVATGTGALALCTAWLARETRRNVKDTEKMVTETKRLATQTEQLAEETTRLAETAGEQAEIARRQADTALKAHEARYEPFLVLVGDVSATFTDDGKVDIVQIEIANVGAGAALGLFLQVVSRDPLAVLHDQPEVSDSSRQFVQEDLIGAGERRTITIAASDLKATMAEQIIPIGSYQDRTYTRLLDFPPKAWLRARLAEKGMEQVALLQSELEGLRWQVEVSLPDKGEPSM